MYEITCLDSYGNMISNFVQWDVNQKVSIVAVGFDYEVFSLAPQVHFANSKSKTALVVQSEVEGNVITAKVPNVLLQESLPLFVYVYLEDTRVSEIIEDPETGEVKVIKPQRTILQTEIPIRKRQKPSDYEYVENIERITADAIKKEISEEISNGHTVIRYLTFVDLQPEDGLGTYESNDKHHLYVSDDKLTFEDITEQKSIDILDDRDKDELLKEIKRVETTLDDKKVDKKDFTPGGIGADPAGTATKAVSSHNADTSAHRDIRDLIANTEKRLANVEDSMGGSGFMRIGNYSFVPNTDGHMTVVYTG